MWPGGCVAPVRVSLVLQEGWQASRNQGQLCAACYEAEGAARLAAEGGQGAAPAHAPAVQRPELRCNRDVAVLKRSGLILLDKMLR